MIHVVLVITLFRVLLYDCVLKPVLLSVKQDFGMLLALAFVLELSLIRFGVVRGSALLLKPQDQ